MPKNKKNGAKSCLHHRLLVARANCSAAADEGAGDCHDNGARTSVSLRFAELSLRHSDVELLQGPFELNDRLISFYYAYLQSRRYVKNRSELHFLEPALMHSFRYAEPRECRCLARDLQLANKQFIFVPLYEGAHWSLLLIARPDRKFFYFDPQDNRHLKLVQVLFDHLRGPLAAEDYAFTVGRCLQQAKDQGHESGVHLMCMTDNLADYVLRCGYATSTLLISVQEVSGMRAAQLQLIRQLGGTLPTSSSKSMSLVWEQAM